MKIFVETYGCQMNEYDTELVKAILAKGGYTFVKDELAADIVMLNTCAIREHAHRKVYGRIHDIRHRRRTSPPQNIGGQNSNHVMIGILGCMTTNLRKELLENRSLDIDFIAGPDSYKRLPDLIREAAQTGEKTFDVTLSEFETYSDIAPVRKEGVNAWIAVMRGCNNFCTFCVVPYTRGRERSRTVENVVEEVRRLADEGFQQVTLLGQNVNSYNHDGADFADLLNAVSHINGIKRIRFTSPHPKDFPDKLLEVVASNPKVCKHIHLPLQAGNNRILDLMSRTYTQEEFLALVEKMRARIPNLALTTDIIAGFPTETDNEFEDTIRVMQKVEFDSAFIFKYSERKNTIAAKKYPDDIPDEKKSERVVRLNELQKTITLQKNERHIGETHDVLVEYCDPKSNEWKGRTDGNKLVTLPAGNFHVGQWVKIAVTTASPHTLKSILFT